jgi:hypothetical protein
MFLFCSFIAYDSDDLPAVRLRNGSVATLRDVARFHLLAVLVREDRAHR